MFPYDVTTRLGQLRCLAMNFVATPEEMEELRALQRYTRSKLLERFAIEEEKEKAMLKERLALYNADAVRVRAQGRFDDANWFAERAQALAQGTGDFLPRGMPLNNQR